MDREEWTEKAMATSQSLLGLVTQLHNMDEVVNSTLMETALKLSSLTDASIFLLIETQEGRRFAGKRHLCDAYTRNSLKSLANDVELEFNPTVTALRHRQAACQRSTNDSAFPAPYDKQQVQQQHRISIPKTQTPHIDRKRPLSRSPQPLQQQQQQEQQQKRQKLTADEFVDFVVKREEEDSESAESASVMKVELGEGVIADADADDRRGDDLDAKSGVAEDDDNDVIVEEYPPPSSSLSTYGVDSNGVGGGSGVDDVVVHRGPRPGCGRGYASDVAAHFTHAPANSLALFDGGGGDGGSPGALLDNNDPKMFPDKLSALDGFSLPELAGEHPVASKIFKSCLYDFAKTVASDFVATLASTGRPYVTAEGNGFIRQRFQLWTRQHPLIQNVYASGMKLNSKRPDGNSVSSDSTMWNYVRNAFSINLKRQLRIASFKGSDDPKAIGFGQT